MRRRVISFVVSLMVYLSASGVSYAEEATQLQAGEILRGKFTQERVLEGFSAPLRSSGRFLISPERGLIWHVEKPFDVSTVMTDEGIAQFNGTSETTNLAASQVPFVTQLYKVLGSALTGDLKALDKFFQVEKSGDTSKWAVLLSPRDAETADASQLVSIAIAGGRHVDRVDITKSSGDADHLLFTEQSTGGEITEAEAALFDKVGKK